MYRHYLDVSTGFCGLHYVRPHRSKPAGMRSASTPMTARPIRVLFSDGIHWRVFSEDENRALWLTDYPNAEYHGGGTPRIRPLSGPHPLLASYRELLCALGENAELLHKHASVCTPHLESIGRIAEALAEGRSAEPEVTSAVRTFGWSYLPDAWGEAVESAWAKFSRAAHGAA
jgi:hypothetical protein